MNTCLVCLCVCSLTLRVLGVSEHLSSLSVCLFTRTESAGMSEPLSSLSVCLFTRTESAGCE